MRRTRNGSPGGGWGGKAHPAAARLRSRADPRGWAGAAGKGGHRSTHDSALVAFDFLPSKFTLSQAQEVFETLRGETMDKRNFRKWLTNEWSIEDYGRKILGRAPSTGCVVSPQAGLSRRRTVGPPSDTRRAKMTDVCQKMIDVCHSLGPCRRRGGSGMRKPTLHDVARTAGVSYSTADRVLNARGRRGAEIRRTRTGRHPVAWL